MKGYLKMGFSNSSFKIKKLLICILLIILANCCLLASTEQNVEELFIKGMDAQAILERANKPTNHYRHKRYNI